MNTKVYFILLVLVVVSSCTSIYQPDKEPDFEALYGSAQPKQRNMTPLEQSQSQASNAISYHNDIKPILDSRCVACHACYDAPCQLKLGSSEGVDRGATKKLVYGGARLKDVAPTRLFIDAVNTEGWRKKGFYPVLNERNDSPQAALDNSLLAKLIQLKRDNPLPESGKLANSFKLDLDRTLECPKVDEFVDYKQKHPKWGMPYALPGLTLKQEYTLLNWLQEGAQFDARPPLSAKAVKSISQWEMFLNRSTLKQQLVSRYIYEHLFIGHIHFQGHPDNEFYHLVRSKTPPGEPVNEIATLLPYDAPGVAKFYYRLRPIEETIVEKTHFVYELSNNKMRRYEELFFKPEYSVTHLPSYQDNVAGNPFIAFVEIPNKSRYQFLLDDAQYFISGFIKGPVCRGQIALSVIRDRFWIAFLKPGGLKNQPTEDQKINSFLAKQKNILSLPGTAGANLGLFGYKKYDELAEQYLKNKNVFVDQTIATFGEFKMEDIWDGGGTNQNAALTVFRHLDSATVVKGLVGDTPLTGWIVDYPLLERIHYLLVAGFNVYSSIDHQLASRSYMDFLRIDGENNFLRLMPDDQRKKMHGSWYKGLSGSIASYLTKSYYSQGYETGIIYRTSHYKKEFFTQLRQYLGKAIVEQGLIYQCQQESCDSEDTNSRQHKTSVAMRELSKLKGQDLDVLPEMSLLRIRSSDGSKDQVYTLLLNKALENVAIMIAEDLRREPELDTVTVYPGFLGSYPNFFFNVQQEQLREFVEAIKNAKSIEDKEAFYSKYGIRRTNPEIWQYVDWFNDQHKKYRGVHAGLFDLNRYHNF